MSRIFFHRDTLTLLLCLLVIGVIMFFAGFLARWLTLDTSFTVDMQIEPSESIEEPKIEGNIY